MYRELLNFDVNAVHAAKMHQIGGNLGRGPFSCQEIAFKKPIHRKGDIGARINVKMTLR